MLVAGCLLAMAAAFAPRVVLVIMWIAGPRVDAAFDTFIIPLLGLIFLPYTTIMYVLVWNPVGGVHGWDWLWIALGVWLDVMKWSRIAENRKNIPGYSTGVTEVAPASAKAGAAPVQASPSDELEKLAELRDQGVITEEEFEAKKKQILDL
jgi:hypothetical protein